MFKKLSAYGCLFCLFNVLNFNANAMNDTNTESITTESKVNEIEIPTTVSKGDIEKFCSGCELLSIVNLLGYYNLQVPNEEKSKSFVENFYDKYFIHQDWKLITKENGEEVIDGAPHPYVAYPGNAGIGSKNNCGYGTFGPVVVSILKGYFDHHKMGYCAITAEDIATEEIIKNYVSKGIPVIIWCTQPVDGSDLSFPVDLRGESTKLGDSWITYHSDEIKKKYEDIYKNSPDKKAILDRIEKLSNIKYTWTRGEHCVLLIGENNDAYIIYDPFRGKVYVKKDSLDKSRKIFGNQIVYIKKK